MRTIYDPLGVTWNWRADMKMWIGIVDGNKVWVAASDGNRQRITSGDTTRTYRAIRRRKTS